MAGWEKRASMRPCGTRRRMWVDEKSVSKALCTLSLRRSFTISTCARRAGKCA